MVYLWEFGKWGNRRVILDIPFAGTHIQSKTRVGREEGPERGYSFYELCVVKTGAQLSDKLTLEEGYAQTATVRKVYE